MKERCQAPGCRTFTDRGICDACDQWVTDQVAEMERGRRLRDEMDAPREPLKLDLRNAPSSMEQLAESWRRR